MKRFDKGYVYYSLFTDIFSTLITLFVFFSEFLSDEESETLNIVPMLPILAGAFVGIYLVFLAYRIVYYRTSGYEFTEKEIKCNRGVIFRKRSVLDFKNVHAVNKKQNIFHKIFGIAILTVDSGSANTAHQAEIVIIEKAKTVDSLLNDLNLLKEGGTRPVANEREKTEEVLLSDKDTLYRFTSKKKMLYALINIAATSLFIAICGLLAIIGIGACKLMLQLDSLGTWGQYFLFSILILLSAMLIASVFSFIGCMIHSFVGYYDFSITRLGNEIRISYGLLERHTNTFSYDKIKAVKITQGIFQRMLGFAAIKLEVIGYTVDGENNQAIGVLVPFCKYSEIGEILGRLLPDFVPDKKQTKSVSYFPFVSWFGLILAVVIGLVVLQAILSLLIFKVSSDVIGTVVLVSLGVGIAIFAVKAVHALLSYQNNGLAIDNGKITAYYGGFTKNVTVFKTNNLVAAESVTTPHRKKAGIVSLVMHLKTNEASNEVKVHIQKDELSEKLESMLRL